MAEVTFPLVLNPAQRSQLFAHLFTYMFSFTLNPSAPRHQPTIEIIKEAGSRLFHLCGDEREAVTFTLSLEEAQAIKNVFTALQSFYEQWSFSETSDMALKHLAACRLLIEEAEQRANIMPQEGQDAGGQPPGAGTSTYL